MRLVNPKPNEDELLENAIDMEYLALCTAKNYTDRQKHFNKMTELQQQRSRRQIESMEREQGIDGR